MEVSAAWSHTSKALETVLEHYGWTSMYGKKGYSFVSEGTTGTQDGKVVSIEEVISSDCAVIRQSNPPVLPIPKGKLDTLEHFAGILWRIVTVVMQSQGQIGSTTNASQKNIDHPKWNRPYRQLLIDNQLVVIASREAPVLFELLDLLENAGWPAEGVPVPRTFTGSVKDGVDALNNKLASVHLQILRLNNNQRIGWKRTPL
jgi:hypothetical protein